MGAVPRDGVGTTSPGWAEVVFHVLAHVPARDLPSSLHSAWYVSFAEALLGPAAQRPLGQDVAVLRVLMRDHRALAAVQGLAFLWRDSSEALACSEREMAALTAHDVVCPRLLAQLNVHAYALEALRGAALLEAEVYVTLPPPALDTRALDEALVALTACAPTLASARVTALRPLTRHGRVLRSSIFVGVPGAGVSLQHVAMQAAHEATVAEVLSHATALPERQVEEVALSVLAERCARTPHAAAHRAWCAQWQVREEHLDGARLSPTQRALRDTCLRG